MGRKLRRFVGALKDQATLLLPPSSASLAVLRATSHLHPSSPPHPLHIAALLSFGRGSRPSAASLSSSLSSRLLSARDPSVALKSLLSLHLLLLSAPFILLDSLLSSLLPRPSGRPSRSPLLLSSFPLSLDFPLSSCVRWYSRLLELRLLLPPHPSPDLSSLLTPHLLSQLDAFVDFLAEASAPPDLPRGNRLVAEVERVVAGDRAAAEDAILARLGEVRERAGSVGFGDAVELACVLRRLADQRHPSDADRPGRFWKEVEEARGIAEEVLVKEGRAVRRGPAGSVSERFGVRTGEVVLFGSNRWVHKQ